MRGKLSSEKDVEPASSQSLDLVKKTNKSAKQIADEVSNVVLGKEETIEMVMAGILANGNILFEDFPGLAKTLMSNTLADALGCEFKRSSPLFLLHLSLEIGLKRHLVQNRPQTQSLSSISL